jgi:hypothetical protein
MAMKTRITTRTLCCLGLLAPIGCGGGGGGGGGAPGGGGPPGPTITGTGFAPSTGPGDTAGYFPVASGDQWQFNYSTTDPKAVAPTAVVTVSVNGTKSVLGATATVLTQTNPTIATGGYDQYVSVSPGGVTALGNTNAGDTITPLIVPYVQMLFPVQLGTVSTVTGQNLPAGNDPSGNAITLDLTQTIANASMETVDVPAGSYAGALKQVTTVTGTAHDKGQSLAVAGTDTAWFVAGLGEVKETISTASGGVTISSSAELRTAIANGQTRGFGAAGDLVTLLQAGDQLASVPLSPAIASDGTNFLIVAGQRQISGGTTTQNWLGTLVAADGTVLGSFNITAPAPPPPPTSPLRVLAGFDGTNYLVVYETVQAPALPTLNAVVISPAGVILAGPNTVATADDGPSGVNFEALAFDGSQYLLVYPQQVTGGAQLYGVFVARLTAQANAPAFAIAPDTGPQGGAAVAFDGTNYLVAWDEQSAAPGVEAVRVSPTGVVLDTAPLRVFDESTATVCCSDLLPAVTFDGANYLVAYRDTRGEGGSLLNATVSAARISKAGALLDGSATTPGIVVSATKSEPIGYLTSVFMGGAHWIIWHGGSDNGLHGSRVSAAGTVPQAWTDGFPLLPLTTITYPVLAAGSAGGYLAWFDGQEPAAVSLAGLRIFAP